MFFVCLLTALELQDDSNAAAKQDVKPTLSCGSNTSPNLNTSLDF